VIDSKKLIREMRTLQVFAPGKPLDGKLIIVDPAYPVALNPFHLPERQALDVLTYMLGDVGEASELQKGAIRYMARAVLASKVKNFTTMRDYFALKAERGKPMPLPQDFENFDDQTKHWFKHTFPGLHAATREGVHQRIMNLLEHPIIEKMLNADRCALNLFEELHEGGKVLLVDTDYDEFDVERTELLGRLFFAFLDQVSSQRTKYDEHKLKPIFVLVDEAGDYVKQDTRFANILIKARAQKICVTVAHQVVADISQANQAYLENAGMKAHLPKRGVVQVNTHEHSYVIPIEQLDFDKLPQMDRPQYAAMREKISQKYGLRKVEAPPTFTPTYDAPA
jgi:hypothetical protein